MLLRLTCLGVVNEFATLRLLPMSDRDQDAEILALRHQITVLERQLGTGKVRFTPRDRAFPAALLYWLRLDVVRRWRLLVRPDTVLRWHRDLVRRRHALASRPKRPGRPRTVRPVRALVLRLARENPSWGYRRVHGELLVLGVKVAASTVWEILTETGVDPAPERSSSPWADFLRSQAEALPACGFFGTVTLSGVRMYVLTVIEHANRRIRGLGYDRTPDRFLGGAGRKDTVLADAGIEVVLGGVRIPRMNSIMERCVQTRRRELLDWTLIWNQRHLLHALREVRRFYNGHRPHQGIANAAPPRPLPAPLADPEKITRLDIRRHEQVGGIRHEYRHAA
ncbi:transposase [Streptomyces sp. S1A1-7]|nr:transposase [Streptomyces sp. S1A1-7]